MTHARIGWKTGKYGEDYSEHFLWNSDISKIYQIIVQIFDISNLIILERAAEIDSKVWREVFIKITL